MIENTFSNMNTLLGILTMYEEFFMALICIITFLISYHLLYEKANLNKLINNKIITRIVFLCAVLAFSMTIFFILDSTNVLSTYNSLIKGFIYGPTAAFILYLFPIGSIMRRP